MPVPIIKLILRNGKFRVLREMGRRCELELMVPIEDTSLLQSTSFEPSRAFVAPLDLAGAYKRGRPTPFVQTLYVD